MGQARSVGAPVPLPTAPVPTTVLPARITAGRVRPANRLGCTHPTREQPERPRFTCRLPRAVFVVAALFFGAYLCGACDSLLAADATKPFRIRVVDDETGRGVPLVELRTVNNIRYVTDSAGIAAFNEPGLMGQRVFFHVESHGYEFPKDGFGFRGKALETAPGGSATLRIKRINLAERLYRVTGAGIYRDSLLVGEPVPIDEPLLNGRVFGSDSVVNAVYRGKIYWFWGDTNRPSYPLGNFHVPGATSKLPSAGGLDPEKGVDLSYFVDDDGFARPTARMPGEGPTWIDGLVTLRDPSGRERLFAAYAKIRPPLTVYQRGLVEFDDGAKRFEKVAEFDPEAVNHPGGHPFRHKAEGNEYVYFARPYPLVRVEATPEALRQPDRYEAFTCLKQGSRLDDPRIDRTADGQVRYAWRADTPAVGPARQRKLVASGHLKEGEGLLRLRDRESGKPVTAHGGSVYWNEHRGRWVMITVESGGTSFLGEVWYAEADTPVGPWVYAVKIVTHEKYSFYNPKQHPMFDKDGGRTLFFEGTFTAAFSGNSDRVPRYDYNQIMYKLDLSDERTALPVPVYRLSGSIPDRFGLRGPKRSWSMEHPVAFFALDRRIAETVAVYQQAGAGGSRLVVGDGSGPNDRQALFYALPAVEPASTEPGSQKPALWERPATIVPLYEFVHTGSDKRAYSTDRDWSRPGFQRTGKPLCRVWKNPLRAVLASP